MTEVELNIDVKLTEATIAAVQALFGEKVEEQQVQLQKTRKEFEGDLTVVVFPFVKLAKKSPEQTAEALGSYLVEHVDEVEKFNVVKGFLNLVIADKYWIQFFGSALADENYGVVKEPTGQTCMVEYSSPNTNKPLHLGHVRNILLGHSVAEILKANGHTVVKVNLVNDRGIHICKSMLAWQKWGDGETPESSGIKGDLLVGKYYVMFDKHYKEQIAELIDQGQSKEEAEQNAALLNEAREMLLKWEADDHDTVELWKTMNSWVYAGFDVTYATMGVDFDKIYYESNTYKLGKSIVEKGVEDGVLYQKDDGSIWADLEADGLDHKLLLRSDGTSVYMTQDIGTAVQRFKEYALDGMVYVVGNEQDYHFKVLALILQKLGHDWAKTIYHLSYGMVELPSGKMKSREGTVVDADDLMAGMIDTAAQMSEELGKSEGHSDEEQGELYKTIGLGALKYFLLKVDPKKKMVFNPEESIDFNGNTGPFIQYTYARIQSVLRKYEGDLPTTIVTTSLDAQEKSILKLVYEYKDVLLAAGEEYSPALLANHIFEIVKEYNHFYQTIPILKEEDEQLMIQRLQLSKLTGNVIRLGMELLGINVPDRM